MISHIIVPLDGSQVSHAALPLARALAERNGAGITLLSVIDPPRDFFLVSDDGSGNRLRAKDVDHLASEESRLQEYLERVKTSFDHSHVSIDVRLGQAPEEIIDAAQSRARSVIIMASHGRTGIGRAVLGSVTSRVVQASTVPVFVTRASSDTRSEYGKQKIDHVAIALDGSRLAEQALDRAYDIFRNNVRYTLIRIVEPVAPGQSYTSEAIASYERKAREIAEDYLRDTADGLSAKGANVNVDVRVTQPSNGIIRIADEFGADMIAMTTHGRSGMGRFFMGSVAERVLQQADKPVMIIRGSE
jgi:nucleotide-binding universal stress UspA family protein